MPQPNLEQPKQQPDTIKDIESLALKTELNTEQKSYLDKLIASLNNILEEGSKDDLLTSGNLKKLEEYAGKFNSPRIVRAVKSWNILVETGKTADVTHWILESAHWVFANDGKTIQVSGTPNTSGGTAAVFRQLSCGPSGTQVRVTNRMQDTAELRATCWYN